jgi:hypothetical protein
MPADLKQTPIVELAAGWPAWERRKERNPGSEFAIGAVRLGNRTPFVRGLPPLHSVQPRPSGGASEK